MSFVSKDNLTQIFQVIKNNFVRKEEIDNYDGFTKSSNVIGNQNNSIIIGTDKQLNSNHVFEIVPSTATTPIKIEKVSSVSASSRTCYYCNTTNGTTPTFKIPDNYKVNYSTNCFTESSESISGVNFKTLDAISTLSYYVMYINIIDRNNIFVDITAEVNSTNLITVDCDINKYFLNYDWYRTNSQYIKSINIDGNPINRSTITKESFKTNKSSSITISLIKGITSFRKMFKDCGISYVDISGKPDSVKDFSYMFVNSTLKSFNLGIMPEFANCEGMFKDCRNLGSIVSSCTKQDIKNKFNPLFQSSVNWLGDANWSSMFEGCINMKYIDLTDWEVVGNSTIIADRMFYNTNKTPFNMSDSDLQYNTIVLPHAPNNKPYIDSAENMFAGCDYLSYIYTKFVKLKSIKYDSFEVYDPIRGLILHPESDEHMDVIQYLLPDELDDEAKAFLEKIEDEYSDLTEEEVIFPGVVFTSEVEKQNIMGDILSINFSRANNGELLSENNHLKLEVSISSAYFSLETDERLETFNINRAGSMGYDIYNASALKGSIYNNFKYYKHTMLISPYYNTDNYYHNDRRKVLSLNNHKFIFIYLWVRPDLSMYIISGVNVENYCNNLIGKYREFYSDSIIEN